MPSSFVQLYIHLVWATWDRLPVLKGEVREKVYACVITECTDLGAKVIALGGTADHVHLFVSLPSALSVADLVKQAKGASSHMVNRLTAPGTSFKWQGSYAAFSVSKSMSQIVQDYIFNQEEHHRAGTTDEAAELGWVEEPSGPFE